MKRLSVAVFLFEFATGLGFWIGANLDWIVDAHGPAPFVAEQQVAHYNAARELVGVDKLIIAFRSDASFARVVLQSEGAGKEELTGNLRTSNAFPRFPR